MQLIIAEKPDQGAKLAAPYKHKKHQGYLEIYPCNQFERGAYVSWAVGHICELVAPEDYDANLKRWSLTSLPILPEKFKHRVMPAKAKQFQLLKDLLYRPQVSEIVIASDAGREGEYIVRIIVQLSGVRKPMKRLWISSLTPQAVQKGFANLREESETRNLYYEALSRSCADWLIGMNCSRVYSLLFQKRGIREVFSTGRVQSPTLALIVKRDKEIAAFKPEPFWEVSATFDMNGLCYRGVWFKGEETSFSSQEEAERIRAFCVNNEAEVREIQKERKEFVPPAFFNLSTLQSVANQIYKYSPQKTLEVAQKLYLEGYISYPRSDSQYVTEEEAKQFPDILQKLNGIADLSPYFPLPKNSILRNKRYVNAAKVTDHYAIVPTEVVPDIKKLKEDERLLYLLIVRRLIAAYYEAAIFDYTRIVTLVGQQETFMTKGRQVVDLGWRKVIYGERDGRGGQDEHDSLDGGTDRDSVKRKDTEDDDAGEELPVNLNLHDRGLVSEVQLREGKTQPPKRYTEGQLITLMKTAGKHLDNAELEKVLEKTEGLGTEATRAGIISVLKDRNYIEVRKNIVYATPKGIMLVDALGNSVLASAEMTAKWEQRLHEIGEGSASPAAFMDQVKRLANKLVQDALLGANGWVIQPLGDVSGASVTSARGKAATSRSNYRRSSSRSSAGGGNVSKRSAASSTRSSVGSDKSSRSTAGEDTMTRRSTASSTTRSSAGSGDARNSASRSVSASTAKRSSRKSTTT